MGLVSKGRHKIKDTDDDGPPGITSVSAVLSLVTPAIVETFTVVHLHHFRFLRLFVWFIFLVCLFVSLINFVPMRMHDR